MLASEQAHVGGTARPWWVWMGLATGVLMLPTMHFAAVDLESRTADGGQFLAQASQRHLSITAAGSVGLLLSVGVLALILGLRSLDRLASSVATDWLTAIGELAVLGLVLSFLGSLVAAAGAHEGFPIEGVRAFGLLADGAGPVLLPMLAGPAVLVAVLGLRRRELPKALGYTSGVLAVGLVLLGLAAPGAGALPAMLWLLVTTSWLAICGVPRMPAAITARTEPSTPLPNNV